MWIPQTNLNSLLKCLNKMSQLPDDPLDLGVAYDDATTLVCTLERLTRGARERVISYCDHLKSLGYTPAMLPMESPPTLEVELSEPELRIELEGMLPFRLTGSVYYLHEKLDAALTRFREETPISSPLFKERCAVVFLHHYEETDKVSRAIRDYDNLERRCILNVLARHFLRDDSPGCCITMDILAPGDHNYTEIRVMPIMHFRRFVQSQQIDYVPRQKTSKKIPAIYQKTGEKS